MTTHQQPNDRDHSRIDELENKVRELELGYEVQFGSDRTSGAIVSLLSSMSTDLKDVKMALFGDAKDGSIGLLVRLDRLEQWSKTARWVIGALFVAGAGEVIWRLFHR